MVRNADDVKDVEHVSFSFIPSLHCDNACSFCMYGAGPDNYTTLDYDAVKSWMHLVDWSKVVGWGFYGGEPAIEMPLYQKFFDLLPHGLRTFVITNGTWSNDEERTAQFLAWCTSKFHIIISGTPEHQLHQNVSMLKEFQQSCPDGITYKFGPEEMHPMGRLASPEWSCSKKCVWHQQVTRLGIFPTGHIILQNCDGVYPVLGHISDMNFNEALDRSKDIRATGCSLKCTNVNDLISPPDRRRSGA